MKGIVVVSRHEGLLNWLRSHYPELMEGAEIIPHASTEDVCGKVVVGNLPLPLAAGAKAIYTPVYDVPPELRGKELTAEDLERLGCHLEAFEVRRAPAKLGWVTLRISDRNGYAEKDAMVLASASGGKRENGTWWSEQLCHVSNDGFYLVVEGGEYSKYSLNPDGFGVEVFPGWGILPITPNEARWWLEENGLDTRMLDYNG